MTSKLTLLLFPIRATIRKASDTRLGRRRRVASRRVFYNAVDGALQIAPAAKSNYYKIHSLGAQAKNSEHTINSNKFIRTFDLVAGIGLLLLVLLSCSSEKYKDQDLSDRERAAYIISRLTLEEKIKLLGGRDGMRTCQIPRLGIPSLNLVNGPNGVGGKPGTAFPNGVAIAATWDEKLMYEIGVAIGNEARAKNVDILLGPCVNIHRLPLGGRNFESYSEDPFLSGRMGVNFVKGVQESGVATSLKHFALNNQESSRGSYDAVVDERALREIYLSAFEMVVKEAKPMTIMAAYNKVRGEYCTQNKYLLTDILRNEWGFDGFVMSDWDATHSTVPAAKAGLDLEMPGKPKYFNENLLKAVKEGKVKESEIDEKVLKILSAYFQMGIFKL